MEARIPLSVPKSQLNYSQTSSTITSVTTEMSKPKKRIFSSGTKKNRAVFNMKNFWSVDNNSKKIVSSKKSSIFDVQYVWRPKTVTTSVADNHKRDLSPTAPITEPTTESSVTYLAPKTTQTSVISPVKPAISCETNVKQTNNSSKHSVKSLTNSVSTHSMSTRHRSTTLPTVPELTTSSTNDMNVETEEVTIKELTDNSRPTSPSDEASNISETPSSPASEASSQSVPITSALTSTVETLTTASDVISSSESS